ncbi:MAG: ABC transporter permease [Thermoproteus sp.]
MFGSVARELRVLVSRRAWPLLAIDAVVNALWFASIALAIAWYGADVAQTLRYTFWGVMEFLIFSAQTWTAAAFSDYVRNGVMDYVAASTERLHVYLIASMLAASILALPGVLTSIAVYYLLLGEAPPVAQPYPFAIALVIFIIASTLISAAVTLWLAALRNPSLAANVIQWVVPISGGMIPPTVMPKGVARWFTLSPLQYVVASLTYSATGTWLVDPAVTLSIGAIVVALFYGMVVYAAEVVLRKFRKCGKWGPE